MRQHAHIAFTIDRSAAMPVFAQIYDALRGDIVSGALEHGARLPPSRSFAADLGVSRSTIIAAYDQLVAEGYAEGRHGSGLFVCPMGNVEMPIRRATPQATTAADVSLTDLSRPLHPGVPDMRLFPYRQWGRCVARIARTEPQALIRATHPFGDLHLRRAIAGHVAEWRGVEASADQIIITAGSTDALEICIRTLMQKGDRIALEDPGYRPLRHFVQSQGLNPLWMDVGPSGAFVPQVQPGEQQPRLAVLTPSHQFPRGGTMAPGQRRAFLNWAHDTGGWIIEDDYDSEFRYAGRPIPALAGFDRSDRTLYIGSFSKIFSNSLRIGFLIAPERLLKDLLETLSRYGTKASIAPQRALGAFMDDGEFYRHLRRVRRIYAERRAAMLNLVRSELADLVDFEDHQAGMQLVLRLVHPCDDKAIEAQAHGIGLEPAALSSHFAAATDERGLIVGFCSQSESENARSIRQLRAVIEKACRA